MGLDCLIYKEKVIIVHGGGVEFSKDSFCFLYV